jgi:hypothetical protein
VALEEAVKPLRSYGGRRAWVQYRSARDSPRMRDMDRISGPVKKWFQNHVDSIKRSDLRQAPSTKNSMPLT